LTNNGELLGELFLYPVLVYVIYWALKKLTSHQYKRPLAVKEKNILIIISIVIMFLLILQSVIRKML
jgi:uncharacterized membrane protein YwzB